MAANPFIPPTTGWLFYNGEDFKEDPYLTCSLPSTSPPCCLTVTLKGAAKEVQGKCEGKYNSSGLVSAGREVKLHFDKTSFFDFEGVQAGRLL